ncbi:MAG: PDZ domain-containing protein, partial [Thermomicrobiaceae bacterium]|nr:PDZ domain-containing protein [Thermomicrobiaceae bacterium]
AGIRVGDTIVALDEAPVSGADDVHRYLARATAGTAIRVGVLRDGQRLDIPVTLAASPE